MWLLSVALAISTCFTLLLLTLPSRYEPSDENDGPQKCSVQIIVLGDIGRSPRMQYHALSVAKHGGKVKLIGYLDTTPLPELSNHPNVSIIGLAPVPKILQTSSRIMFLLLAPFKVLLQIWKLWYALGYELQASKWMLVQNPPSIPTLLIASLVCFLRRTRLIIDWHNFGYSILALKLGPSHPFVKLSKLYEQVFAKSAAANITVTNAMARVLHPAFVPDSRTILTLHDRPAKLYQPLRTSERLAFLQTYPLLIPHINNILDQKTRVLVSSTSWTADEDFAIFLDALVQYSSTATSTHPQLPELIVIITGKGPLQAHYQAQVRQLKDQGSLELVTVHTDFLPFADYASLLGSADLGVSLHTSSSGVDLPMKVVDMFGAGLPVLGWSKFAAWPELVSEDVNGKGFGSAEEMAAILISLFEPENKLLGKLKEGAIVESKRRWDPEWDGVLGKVFGLT